jgi:glycosyltransferase involved in cell wall biosynthesis/SAM-dependent methyltransferase
MAKRIYIVVNSLLQGGAQKSALLLSQELFQAGHNVRILTFYPEETDFFQVPKGIKIERLIHPFQDRGRVDRRNRVSIRLQRILNRVRDFFELRKLFTRFRPDLVISFEAATSILTFFANYGLSPQIISERVHPEFHSIPKWASALRPYVYRSKMTVLHCQGNSIAKWMQEKYKKNVFVIPNFLGQQNPEIWNSNSKKVKIFSRYSHQKGIDLAITAWSMIDQKIRRDFSLEIFGDGDRTKYLNMVAERSLDSSIKLNGPTKNVQYELSDCLLYLMPSRFEGFPNSLAEAMGRGIPSLATDSPSAIRDLTLDGKLAKLSQATPEALAKNLEYLLTEKVELEKLGENGKLVREYFKDQNTLTEWTDLIEWVLGGEDSDNFKCIACGGKLGKPLAHRTRAGLKRELYSSWGINPDLQNMGPSSVLTARKCSKCDSISFNGEEGDSDFYESCYKSMSYSREISWDYDLQIQDLSISERKLNVLDFGGGVSPFSKIHPDKIDLSVVDLSRHVHKELKLLNVNTYFELSEISINLKFDHINLSHTIEHVNFPVHLVHSLVSQLNKGGRLCISTPDARNPYLLSSPLAWPPHHTIGFSTYALVKILSDCGLRNIAVFRNKNHNDASFDFMVSGEF